MRRAFIFANGKIEFPPSILTGLRADDLVIAADGGTLHCQRLGITPGVIIGDFDSLGNDLLEAYKRMGVIIIRYPPHKDETDLELAVESVLREGYTTVLIAGALGGRLDMTLANIFLLGLPELAGIDIRLVDGIEEVFLIHPYQTAEEEGRWIDGQPGDRVSLLPLGGPARGIFTSGLYYPLRGETLYPERTRGVSNQMTASQAQVSLEEGQLICIHTRQAIE